MIVPGHGRLCDEVGRERLPRHGDDRPRPRARHGKKKMTLDQVKAAQPTRDYDGVYAQPADTGDMFVEAVYRSLTPAQPRARWPRCRGTTMPCDVRRLLDGGRCAGAACAGAARSGGSARQGGGRRRPGRGRSRRRRRDAARAPHSISPGTWVSVVTEDWRWRMVTPPKNDYASVPLNAEGRKVADAWDLDKDNAVGEPVPRVRRGGDHAPAAARADLVAGRSDAEARHRRRAADAALPLRSPGGGTRTSSRTRRRAHVAGRVRGRVGQAGAEPRARVRRPRRCRRRGRNAQGRDDPDEGRLPAQERRAVQRGRRAHRVLQPAFGPGDLEWFTVTTVVDDPKYLAQPFITSSSFRREPDNSKWKPGPCETAPPTAAPVAPASGGHAIDSTDLILRAADRGARVVGRI